MGRQTKLLIIAVDNGYVIAPEPEGQGFIRLAQWVARDLDELSQLVSELMVERPTCPALPSSVQN